MRNRDTILLHENVAQQERETFDNIYKERKTN